MQSKAELVFENLWQKQNTVYHEGVKQLWKKHLPLFTDEKIDKRLPQVVFAVRNSSGETVGVATAYRTYVEQLKHHLYAFPCFVDPDHRHPGLPSALIVKTRDWLESVHETDGAPDMRCIGMITIVENEQLMKHRNEAVWRASQMVYIGNTPTGQHIRVYYFKNALI